MVRTIELATIVVREKDAVNTEVSESLRVLKVLHSLDENLPCNMSRIICRSSYLIEGSMAESSNSPTVPPVETSDANSSGGGRCWLARWRQQQLAMC